MQSNFGSARGLQRNQRAEKGYSMAKESNSQIANTLQGSNPQQFPSLRRKQGCRAPCSMFLLPIPLLVGLLLFSIVFVALIVNNNSRTATTRATLSWLYWNRWRFLLLLLQHGIVLAPSNVPIFDFLVALLDCVHAFDDSLAAIAPIRFDAACTCQPFSYCSCWRWWWQWWWQVWRCA